MKRILTTLAVLAMGAQCFAQDQSADARAALAIANSLTPRFAGIEKRLDAIEYRIAMNAVDSKLPNDTRTFGADGKATSTTMNGVRYPLNQYGGVMWWAPIATNATVARQTKANGECTCKVCENGQCREISCNCPNSTATVEAAYSEVPPALPTAKPPTPPKPVPPEIAAPVPAANTTTETTIKEKKHKTIVTQRTTTAAFDEVNAHRARLGLRPFAFDPALSAAAEKCAQYRASIRHHGHVNDFAFIGSGVRCDATGAEAPGQSYNAPGSPGWWTCCTEDNYTAAGAGSALDANGERYMSLFVSYAQPSPGPLMTAPVAGEAAPVCADGTCQILPSGQMSCASGTCATGACSSGSCSSGGCSSGSCGSSGRRGLFRRR